MNGNKEVKGGIEEIFTDMYKTILGLFKDIYDNELFLIGADLMNGMPGETVRLWELCELTFGNST